MGTIAALLGCQNTTNQEQLFGQVVDGEMVLNEYGEIVQGEWFRSTKIRNEIELFLDEFIVMPNHMHGIVWIVETDDWAGRDGSVRKMVGAHGRAPLHRPPRSLGSFIAGFKSAVTRHINEMRSTPGARVWQRNYYEHIIRNEKALNLIRQYIVQNPFRWLLDRYNPEQEGIDPIAQEIRRVIHRPAENINLGVLGKRKERGVFL